MNKPRTPAREIEASQGITYKTEFELPQVPIAISDNAEIAEAAKLADPYYKQDKWDLRFLEMSKLVAGWSKDPSTKTGAVIVRPDKSVASVGFNGFPKPMRDATELYENRDEKYSRIVHCEMNAVLFARESVQGYTLYTWPYLSCDRCCVQMLQAGIKRFVFPIIPVDKMERWDELLKRSKSYIEEAGAVWTEWNNGFKKSNWERV